jgi:hypothetical protein
MKKIFLTPLFGLFLFCSGKKEILPQKDDTGNQTAITQEMVKSKCPEDGKCNIEIFRNKSLDINSNEFGSIYYTMIDTDNVTVVKYVYKRNPPKEDLKDGNYSEEIVFQINNSDSAIALKDGDLQTAKMLFGRFCYCKGQTGYYKVNLGNLSLSQKDKAVQFNLDFKITEVPQIINAITGIVQ